MPSSEPPRDRPSRVKPARAWRLPPEISSWRATAFVVLLIVAPPLLTFWLSPNTTTLAQQADIVGLFVYPVALTAALHVHSHWRLTGNTAAGVVSMLLFAAAVEGLSRVALRVGDAGYAATLASHALQFLVVDVLFALVLLVSLTLLPQRGLRVDPGAWGITIGILFCALRFVAANDSRLLDPDSTGTEALQLVLLGLYLMVAVALLRLHPLPGWVRVRLGVAMVLLSVNHTITHPAMGETWYLSLAIATDLLGATLLVSTTMTLLRGCIAERIDEAERHHQGDRERLHEMVSTVAGIACANRLIHQADQIPQHRREQLQQMVGSEIARLERLMQDRGQPVSDVDLDATIRPLVVAHSARGHETHWTPTGLTARARQDDIAEVVHVLLDNAARHATGAPVSITGHELDDGIEIRVQDTGPGIPRDLEDRIFLHGQRGPGSTGQGIGLNVAARLMSDMGGSLQLLPTTQGTSFVLRMPKARSERVEPSSPAQ